MAWENRTHKRTHYILRPPPKFRNAAWKLRRRNTQVVHYPSRIPGNNPQLSLDVHFVCCASGRNALGFYKFVLLLQPDNGNCFQVTVSVNKDTMNLDCYPDWPLSYPRPSVFNSNTNTIMFYRFWQLWGFIKQHHHRLYIIQRYRKL